MSMIIKIFFFYKISAVPSAPTALEVTNITSKSVSLRWKSPEFLGNTELTGRIHAKF